jgi:hypothetical protein
MAALAILLLHFLASLSLLNEFHEIPYCLFSMILCCKSRIYIRTGFSAWIEVSAGSPGKSHYPVSVKGLTGQRKREMSQES